MKFFARFPSFSRRFALLWGVWLLVLLIPASREVWRLHVLGSPFGWEFERPWSKMLAGRQFNRPAAQ